MILNDGFTDGFTRSRVNYITCLVSKGVLREGMNSVSPLDRFHSHSATSGASARASDPSATCQDALSVFRQGRGKNMDESYMAAVLSQFCVGWQARHSREVFFLKLSYQRSCESREQCFVVPFFSLQDPAKQYQGGSMILQNLVQLVRFEHGRVLLKVRTPSRIQCFWTPG